MQRSESQVVRAPGDFTLNGVPYTCQRGAHGELQFVITELPVGPGIHVQTLTTNPNLRQGSHPTEYIVSIDSAHHGAGDTNGWRVHSYDRAADVDPRIKGRIVLASKLELDVITPTATPTQIINFDGHALCIETTAVDNIANPIANDLTGGLNETFYRAAIWDGNLYLTVNNTANTIGLKRRAVGGAWTNGSGWGALAPRCLAKTTSRLYVSISKNQIQYINHIDANGAALDPRVYSNWVTPAVPVGESNFSINEMVTVGDQLYCMKDEGLFMLDSNLNGQNLTPDVIPENLGGDYANGTGGCVWQGHVVYPTSRHLYFYQNGSIFDADPRKQMDASQIGVSMFIKALWPIGKWLAAAVINTLSGGGYLMLGRLAESDDDLPAGVIWHFWRTTTAQLLAIAVAPDGQPGNYLYAAAAARFNAYDIPPDAPRETTMSYHTSGSITFPYLDLGTPSIKLWNRFEIEGDSLDANDTIQLQYSADGAAFVALTPTATSTPTVYTPTPIAAYRMQLRAVLASAGSTLTPVLRRIRVVCEVRPVMKRAYEITVRVQQGQQLGNNIERRSGATEVANLRTLSSNSAPVTLSRENEPDVSVIVQPGVKETLVVESAGAMPVRLLAFSAIEA